MKYYKLTDYYPRDVFFSFSDKNSIQKSNLEIGLNSSSKDKLIYTVDKFDSYVGEYDILPTIGAPLVSLKLKQIIEKFNIEDCQFIPAIIEDTSSGKINEYFFAMNILNSVECLDKEKSEIKPLMKSFPNGPIKINNLFFKSDKLKDHCIVRMLESKSIIVVNFTLLEKCKEFRVKGTQFVKEGNQLSPSFVDYN
ncbi:imm11 family protein [Algibacter lectus]|uniref:Immunity MXAN-0049 protein domain-containing protein n=1 Tax=Algibacter lectus TaxID=221126 RepID=A0A4V3HH84_9FLAO|nr:DUF1629 domain-containing protein [Algibacter lectus]MWW23122.1 hypothetical protein [Algibacter lectus]TDY64201.1 hypothetical protein DFQ06_1106 [Algibacter lectus]